MDEEAQKALLAAVDDPDPIVQAEAIRSLVGVDGEIGERFLERTMELFATTESTDVRDSALKALARLGHGIGGARPFLIAQLDASEPDLRAAAAQALQRIDSPVENSTKRDE